VTIPPYTFQKASDSASEHIQGAYTLSEDSVKSYFTNTEQKYMMLLPFERGMCAVS